MRTVTVLFGRSPAGFNPRTRDGCEVTTLDDMLTNVVSIHAPVMGAKQYLSMLILSSIVSIHAPVMGANAV